MRYIDFFPNSATMQFRNLIEMIEISITIDSSGRNP